MNEKIFIVFIFFKNLISLLNFCKFRDIFFNGILDLTHQATMVKNNRSSVIRNQRFELDLILNNTFIQ